MYTEHFHCLDFDDLFDDLTSNDVSEMGSFSSMSNDCLSFGGYSSCDDNSSLTSGSSKSNSVVSLPKQQHKKQRGIITKKDVDFFQRVAFASKPKIVKSDIRRSYFNMFVNILNSCDFPLIYGFMDTYLVPSAQQQMLKPKTVDREPYCVDEFGPANIARHWYTMVNIAPDATFTATEDTKIYLTSATTKSTIVARFVFTGTMMYDVSKFSTSLVGNSSLHSVIGSKRKDEMSEKHEEITRIEKSVHDTISKLPLNPTPEVMTGEMVVTFQTDENRYISNMEVNMRERPLLLSENKNCC